jgi:hypothetical protein
MQSAGCSDISPNSVWTSQTEPPPNIPGAGFSVCRSQPMARSARVIPSPVWITDTGSLEFLIGPARRRPSHARSPRTHHPSSRRDAPFDHGYGSPRFMAFRGLLSLHA